MYNALYSRRKLEGGREKKVTTKWTVRAAICAMPYSRAGLKLIFSLCSFFSVSEFSNHLILCAYCLFDGPRHSARLSAGKESVRTKHTRLKFICFLKTSHLIFKNSIRVSINISTFCGTNPYVSLPKIISHWPMRCLKREPACLISASFC